MKAGTAKQALIPVKILTVTAMLTAMNIVMSSFGIPVPGGHLYLNDVIICTASMLLNPFCAFVVGGIGAFLGDFFFYPAPMFVSLVTHGLQAVVISIIARGIRKNASEEGKTLAGSGLSLGRSIAAVAVGAVIMVAGYTFGRAYIYSTVEYSIMKLPYQILQAVVGAVCAIVLVFPLRLGKLYRKIIGS